VRQLIDIARKLTGPTFLFDCAPPAGDPPALVSNPALLRRARLGWSAAMQTSQTKWRMLGLARRAGAALSSERRRSLANEAQTGQLPPACRRTAAGRVGPPH